MKHTVRGIVFDMDNTLLRSHIDFQAMKVETYAYLLEQGLISPSLPIEEQTTSTLIQSAMDQHPLTEAERQALWAIPAKHETKGMYGAELEPGVRELLEELVGHYYLTIVTNNSVEAARHALQENGIWSMFDWVAGREQMQQLKPSPSGFLAVLERFPEWSPLAWISVGDAWIDGAASAAAGIPFIAYHGNIKEMQQRGVRPLSNITHIHQIKAFL